MQDNTNADCFIEDFALNKISFRKNRYFSKYHKSVSKLLSIQKPSHLVRFFSVRPLGRVYSFDFDTLQQLILDPKYIEFEIPKKNNTVRKIQAPNLGLKIVQSYFNQILQLYYYFWIKPDFVHGFVIRPKGESKMCNIVSNAQSHIRKKYVLNIDLKDFFSNISIKQVYKLFRSNYFKYNDQIAKYFTFLTTYNGYLPTGAPTSPVLSNFICIELDFAIKAFCDKNDVAFSRYADDLTFSADFEFTPSYIVELKELITKHGFQVNPKKVYIKKSNSKQTVTGLIVNKKVNVDRKLLKKVRAMIHSLRTKGIENASYFHYEGRHLFDTAYNDKFIYQLKGYINFIGQVRGIEDVLYLKLKGELTELKV
jgi:RNA-directed DNA polymerase